MIKKVLLSVLFLCMAVASVSAADLDAFNSLAGNLDIAGGTAHIPVMKLAARAIMTEHPRIRITVAGGGSGAGVRNVGEGLAQIGNTGRPLKQTEIDKYGLVSFPFAVDGVAVAVNPANPVSALSREQLAGIFSGRVRNWNEVGGTDAPISLYIREDGSGTREVFEESGIRSGDISSRANIVSSNGAMKMNVSQDVNAIGYVGVGHLTGEIKGIVLDGMEPTQENAADGQYDVTRLLFMNTVGQPEGLTRAFIDYIYSDSGAGFIRQSGYIPVGRDG